MSLKETELLEHCQFILANRQIRNKFVILCEGEIKKTAGRLSPQSYRAMEDFPDANFYKACVPRDWRQQIPTFFNCGDRNDVLNTYFNLLRLHQENPEASYLNPQQLFAIVDLDLQNKRLDDSYPFKDLEQIFEDLYKKSLNELPRRKRTGYQNQNRLNCRFWCSCRYSLSCSFTYLAIIPSSPCFPTVLA